MIGILGALTEEISMLRAALRNRHSQTFMGRRFEQGILYGQEVVLAESGLGKVGATLTATTLANRYPLTGMIVTGVSASLSPHLKTGDVVLSYQGVEHDFGTVRPGGFVLGLDFLPGKPQARVQTDPYLFDMAMANQERFVFHTRPTPQVRAGVVATGDTFVANPDVRDQIFKLTEADVLEMEGTAVLKVACAAGIPCLLIRSVSNTGDSSDAFLNFFRPVAYHSAAVVKTLLESLTCPSSAPAGS